MAASIPNWYLNDNEVIELPHKKQSTSEVSMEQLAKLGVRYYKLDLENYEEPLKKLREDHGYNYMDICECSPGKLPNYDCMMKNFYTEHIHADDEIRFVLAGTGYFDVRDADDKWIRLAAKPGDLVCIPAGLYHRFSLDSNNYIKAMRLFCGSPVWTAYYRPADSHPIRQSYLQRYIGGRCCSQPHREG